MGPFERGSPEWYDREIERRSNGCRNLGLTKIPDDQVTRVAQFSNPQRMPSPERLKWLRERQLMRLNGFNPPEEEGPK